LHVPIDDEHYSDDEGRSDTPSFIALSRTKSNTRKTENEGLKKGTGQCSQGIIRKHDVEEMSLLPRGMTGISKTPTRGGI
jgi:hypothetical protein